MNIFARTGNASKKEAERVVGQRIMTYLSGKNGGTPQSVSRNKEYKRTLHRGATSRAAGRAHEVSREFAEFERFKQYKRDELTAVDEIAAPETARFTGEPEEPLEAVVPQPWRR